jgi:hypothetical protein
MPAPAAFVVLEKGLNIDSTTGTGLRLDHGQSGHWRTDADISGLILLRHVRIAPVPSLREIEI